MTISATPPKQSSLYLTSQICYQMGRKKIFSKCVVEFLLLHFLIRLLVVPEDFKAQ